MARAGSGTTYVALLRGINLGKNNRVPMAGLRALCEEMGATDVRTYIASGNVVLNSTLSAANLRERLEHGIEREFGISIVVVVLTASELAAIVERNPFNKAEAATLHAAFAAEELDKTVIDRLRAIDRPPEQLSVDGRTIYYDLPNGYGLALLPKEVDRTKAKVTARNWRTVTTLNEMANS